MSINGSEVFVVKRAEDDVRVERNEMIKEENDEDYLLNRRGIYYRLLFLNLVILWAYQSLISAQNYYSKNYPTYHLDFWGTVSAGSTMFCCHLLQLYFGVYKYGFTKRVIPGYLGYIVISILVMSIKDPYLLIVSFGLVGGLNTMTESPVYGIAGLFSTGIFTQAVQVGNGLAGFLNVMSNTIIRLIVDAVHSSVDEDQLSFYLFMSLLVILCCLSIWQYFSLIKIPSVARRLNEQKENFSSPVLPVGGPDKPVQLSFWALSQILKVHLFVQFYVLFVSLFLWPGIPCGARTTGWFHENKSRWWCSPFIVGTFNLGDLFGRTIASRVHRFFSSRTCLICALARTAFIFIVFYRNEMDNVLLLVLILLLGTTNGLLATVTFMVRPPSIVGVENCERAAYLMTAALYGGIAGGSILAAVLALTNVV